MESFSFTFSMLSSHRVRYTLPVSSPTNASQTLCAEPSLPIGISRISLFETTFAVTFTALDCGVNSPTLASTGVLGCLLSKKPSTAKLIQLPVSFLNRHVRFLATLKPFGEDTHAERSLKTLKLMCCLKQN